MSWSYPQFLLCSPCCMSWNYLDVSKPQTVPGDCYPSPFILKIRISSANVATCVFMWRKIRIISSFRSSRMPCCVVFVFHDITGNEHSKQWLPKASSSVDDDYYLFVRYMSVSVHMLFVRQPARKILEWGSPQINLDSSLTDWANVTATAVRHFTSRLLLVC